MKILRLLSLVGITAVALSPIAWAAPHGGGGGGFVGGGHPGGGGGRAGFGGAPHFGGGGFGAPHVNFGGVGNRGGGVGFGMQRSPGRVSAIAAGPGPARGRSFVPSRSPALQSSGGRSTRGLTNVGRGNRTGNGSGRATAGLNRPNNRGINPSNPHRGLNGRMDHIAERHDGNWHRDWDHRRAHFDHDRFFVFEDGFWFGLDDGFFPWDYLPYYAYDYYPYDYYPYATTTPAYRGAPVADATVQAVQTQLAQLGYYSGPVDGIFGPATRDAVAKYQIANQLSVTGSLSPDTLQSLGLPQATAS